MRRLIVGGSVKATMVCENEGKPVPIIGVPVWVSTNVAVANVVPSSDGMTATINAVGVGDARITVNAVTADGPHTAEAAQVHVDLAPSVNTNAVSDFPSMPGKLGPHYLRDFVGQGELKQFLVAMLIEAKATIIPLPHLLLCGPPDSGKATLALCIANELGTTIHFQCARASTIKSPADMLPYLTNVTDGSILLIEDIDSLTDEVCGFLEPALEDFRVDIVLGEGASARTMPLPLKRFTAIGTTSKPSRVSKKLARWFAVCDFKPYTLDEFSRWLWTLAKNAGLHLPVESLPLLVNCCQGSRLHAAALVKKVRARIHASTNEILTPESAKRVLASLGYVEGRTHSLNLLDKLNFMSGPEFEEFVAGLFRGMGYLVELTEITGDHGIDLLMHQMGTRTIVQCKRWKDAVGAGNSRFLRVDASR